MDENKEHFRHVMLFYFRKEKNASQTARKICSVYGEGAVAESTVRKWFVQFRCGNFDVTDKHRSGRPVSVDDENIQSIVENESNCTTRSIAAKIQISPMSVVRHLRKLNYVNCYDVFIPRQLTEGQLKNRLSICKSLLLRHTKEPFLKRIITGDEKWIAYNNPKRKRSWQKRNEPRKTTPKRDIHSKKVMLSIWWDWKGVLYYELIPQGQAINSLKYCSQLEQLKAAIDEKRPSLANRKGIILQHDNARPHVSFVTQQKIAELGWEQLSHPPYSPDLAPSDFHFFRSLQHFFTGTNFKTLEDCKKHLDQFISEKSEKFFQDGIFKLPQRWEQVVQQDGSYVID